jgi:hypothetical protein
MKTQPAVKLLLMSAVLLALVAVTRAEEPKDPFKKSSADSSGTIVLSGSGGGASEGSPAAAPEPILLLSLEEETFSLPIGEAFALLRKFPADADRYEELVRRVDAGKARLERLIRLRAVSGYETRARSVTELIYPAGYSANTEANKVGNAIPNEFKTREVGDTLNATPTLEPEGKTINLTLISERTRFNRYDGPDQYKVFHQPLIESHNFTTSISCRDGVPVLLGTFNPPSDNGLTAAQEQRVWLSFMTVRVLDMSKVRSTP